MVYEHQTEACSICEGYRQISQRCYVLVPKQPTEEMERAGMEAGAGFLAKAVYQAMVKSAQGVKTNG